MKATCYLILEGVRSYRGAPISKVRVVGVRKGRPALSGGEVAIRLHLEVPASAFDPTEVAVVVEPRHVELMAELEEPLPDERDEFSLGLGELDGGGE